MPRSIDIVGRKFGYLTLTRQVDPLLSPWRGRRAPLRVTRFEISVPPRNPCLVQTYRHRRRRFRTSVYRVA